MEDTVVMRPPRGRGLRRPLIPITQAIQKDDGRRLGRNRTGALARAYNRRAARLLEFRRRAYGDMLANGDLPRPPIEMADGFALDESRSLPHVDALVTDGEDLIGRYGGQQWEFTKPYLQDISPESAMDTHPSLLNFIASPEVVATAAPTFGYIPALPGTIPEGVRLMESSTKFDPQAEGPWRESRLFHADYHSLPTVYVIVAVRDIGPDDGPLHFLGKAASERVAEALDYGARRTPYRLTDEVVCSIVDESEVHRFTAKAGTVLFLESSACMHFGSRNPAKNRYQWQFSFTSPLRNDFMELWRPRRAFPVADTDTALRHLVLDADLLELT